MNTARSLATLVLLAVPFTLWAQEVASLPDLQVTATREPAPRATVPAAVTVLDGQQLRDRGITTLLDALRLTPAASVVQLGSYGAVTSFFMRGGESDYTKVLIDGVVVNEPGGGINLAAISLDDIERIEIMRGPGSVLYGADAISGVVQLFTRRGRGALHGSAEATAGSFHGRDFRLNVAGASTAWSASVGASRFVSDGIYPFNSDFDKTVGSTRLGWEGTKGNRVDVTARLTEAKGHFPTDGNGDPIDRDQFTLNRDLVLGLRYSQPINQTTDLTAELWTHRLDSEFRDASDTPADTSGFAFAGTRDAITSRRGALIRANWRLRPGFSFAAGFGIDQEEEDQAGITASNFGGGVTHDSAHFAATRSTRNAFAQLRAAPMRPLTLQLGARVDDNSDFGSFATVRIGAVAELAPSVRFWAAYGTGFKAPTFSELLAASAYEVGNPALRPEQSRSGEAGFELASGESRLGVTLFTQNFSDFVQYVAAAPGEPTYANLGAARSRGAELAVSSSLSPGLAVEANLTWLSTAVTDTGATSSPTFLLGQSLLRRPGVTATLSLRGKLHRVAYTATGRWVGSRDDVSFRDFPATRTRLPYYTLFDASAAIPITLGAATSADLLLRGENLFDAEWESAIGYPGRGRTLFGGVRLTF